MKASPSARHVVLICISLFACQKHPPIATFNDAAITEAAAPVADVYAACASSCASGICWDGCEARKLHAKDATVHASSHRVAWSDAGGLYDTDGIVVRTFSRTSPVAFAEAGDVMVWCEPTETPRCFVKKGAAPSKAVKLQKTLATLAEEDTSVTIMTDDVATDGSFVAIAMNGHANVRSAPSAGRVVALADLDGNDLGHWFTPPEDYIEGGGLAFSHGELFFGSKDLVVAVDRSLEKRTFATMPTGFLPSAIRERAAGGVTVLATKDFSAATMVALYNLTGALERRIDVPIAQPVYTLVDLVGDAWAQTTDTHDYSRKLFRVTTMLEPQIVFTHELSIANDGTSAEVIGDILVVRLPPTTHASHAAEASAMDVLNRWNAAHNVHDVNALAALYAPTVTFYGTPLPSSECAKRKQAALSAAPTYAQSTHDSNIASDPTRIAIHFTKTSQSNGKSKDYPAVLVLDASMKIIEEDDDPAWIP